MSKKIDILPEKGERFPGFKKLLNRLGFGIFVKKINRNKIQIILEIDLKQDLAEQTEGLNQIVLNHINGEVKA